MLKVQFVYIFVLFPTSFFKCLKGSTSTCGLQFTGLFALGCFILPPHFSHQIPITFGIYFQKLYCRFRLIFLINYLSFVKIDFRLIRKLLNISAVPHIPS